MHSSRPAESDTRPGREELRRSRLDIEEHLNQSVESFAYPYGYVSEVAGSVAAREFRATCLTELRCATSEALHSLPRVDAYYLTTLERLRKLVEGRLEPYLTFCRLGRRVRAALVG